MGMMLHRHLGVDEESAPKNVIKEKDVVKPDVEQEEKKDSYVNDPVHRGRKRKD